MKKIKVIDIFAGPGGLGEGFADFSPRGAAGEHPFEIAYSAEKDLAAVRTLRLRTFYRLCRDHGDVPNCYYDYIQDSRCPPYDDETERLWQETVEGVQPIELGTPAGSRKLREALKRKISRADDWILIGGPPCQAYSVAGRSRNRGIRDYRPERDKRHFLYRHYLNILAEYRPAAFVMENVKGILTSKVGNELIFPQVLKDLSKPNGVNGSKGEVRYQIHSLATSQTFCPEDDPDGLDPENFVVRSEEYGIPQTRHRVILIGIREDGHYTPTLDILRRLPVQAPLEWALRSLPPLRSGLSKGDADTQTWRLTIQEALREACKAGLGTLESRRMRAALHASRQRGVNWNRGGRFVKVGRQPLGRSSGEKRLLRRLQSEHLHGVPNHYTRNHMPMDLVRYLFAATFAAEYGRTPKSRDFPLALAPAHKNWNSGDFDDRFRVQFYGSPSSTVTSHISKDGHYFIHPDPAQCRSLTVREAARLQTFPDDYFFEGTRTEQYIQVGNAVPPILAEKIAGIIYRAIS